MVAVNKQVCRNLHAKGRWSAVMCGLCTQNKMTCEIYAEYSSRMFEDNNLRHDERRELVREGVENGD